MKTIEHLKKEIISSNGMGEELFDKTEFAYLTKWINDDEVLDSVMVCLIDGVINLIGFTDKRLFFVSKENILPSIVKRKGLEEIRDIELKDTQTICYLTMSLYDGTSYKIEGISLQKAQKFGKQIINRIQNWVQQY